MNQGAANRAGPNAATGGELAVVGGLMGRSKMDLNVRGATRPAAVDGPVKIARAFVTVRRQNLRRNAPQNRASLRECLKPLSPLGTGL